MKMSSWRLAMAAGLLSLSGLAQATLEKQTVNGVNLVYDPDSDRTWVQDANLFETQYTADNNLVNEIIAAVPTITDSQGSHAITAGEFDTSTGQMDWYAAMAWVEWLNATDYGGADNWGLPSALNANGTDPCGGYNCTGSDLGNLFYTVGGLSAGQSITGSTALNADVYPATGAFTNLQDYVYWSGTEYAPRPNRAWGFGADDGLQYFVSKGLPLYGWAVRPGQVAAIPEPATALLMALGLAGVGWARRDRRRPG